MSQEPSPHRGFDVGRQLSVAVIFAGALGVTSHFASQARDGSAPLWLLVVGINAMIIGLLLTLLFSILLRLDRIEQQISAIGRESSEGSES